jgi:hypothetical protein
MGKCSQEVFLKGKHRASAKCNIWCGTRSFLMRINAKFGSYVVVKGAYEEIAHNQSQEAQMSVWRLWLIL